MALTMHFTLCFKGIKISCGWRLTFKATQPYLNLIISNCYCFCVYSLFIFVCSYDFDELIKIM